MFWIKDDASMNAKYCQKSQMMKPALIQIPFEIKEDLKRKTFIWNRH